MNIKYLLPATLLPFFVTISHAEAQVVTTTPTAISSPTVSAHAEAQALPPRLAAADANKDGKVSKDELVAFVTKKAEEKLAEKVKRLDTNGDKFLTRDELKGKKGWNERFDDIDTNKDGKLSKDEIIAFVQKKADERAIKLFQKIDTSGDGFITADEVKRKDGKKAEEALEQEDL